jgi:hypothetical protein
LNVEPAPVAARNRAGFRRHVRSAAVLEAEDFLTDSIFQDLHFLRAQIRNQPMVLVAGYEIQQYFLGG